MTAGGGYEVLTDELDTHAGKVDVLADRLKTAVAAAQQVSMDNGAYGVICQPFALLLEPFERLGIQALHNAEDSVTGTAGKVRAAARGYQSQEAGVGRAISSLGEPLHE